MTENTDGMTRRIAKFIVNTDEAKIPDEVYAHAKTAFMDWIAVTIGGKDDPLVEKLIDYTEIMGGNEHATILGHNMKKSISQAALINGSASHALDYDDTLVSFLGHPSVTIFPSVLALAEWKEKSGREFLNAYLIGLQAGGTIGACASLDHYMAGWHATSTLGHLASAAGCARLLNLDEQKTIYALGIGGTQSSGLKRVFGTMCKPFHAGRSSQSGLMAALLAMDNFTSATDILEGPKGFFEALKGNVNEEILGMIGLGWDIKNLSQKYHASCHATHSPLEAAMAVINEKNIEIDEIKEIRVYSSQLALDAAGKMSPTTGLEGKFSIPYCVANALLRGITGVQAFTDEKVNDEEVKQLMKRISVKLDTEKTALEASVEVETASGEIFKYFSDILQQIPPLDIKQKRVRAKYFDLCEPILGRERTEKIAENIDRLETISSMNMFTKVFSNGK